MNDKFDELSRNMAQSVTRRSGDYILAHALQRLHGDPPLNSSVTSE